MRVNRLCTCASYKKKKIMTLFYVYTFTILFVSDAFNFNPVLVHLPNFFLGGVRVGGQGWQ